MGRTTIARDLIEMIRLGKVEKDEILRALADGTRGAEQLRCGVPAVVVRFHELVDEPARAHSLARGTAMLASPPVYKQVAEAPLYELTDADRVDVLRFGRHPDQDVQLLDRTVSREHGLVIYGGKLPLFCDYGTLQGGKHAGSLNGTYLDGASLIRDAMIPWLPATTLMLGLQHTRPGLEPCFAFRVTYELVAPDLHVN